MSFFNNDVDSQIWNSTILDDHDEHLCVPNDISRIEKVQHFEFETLNGDYVDLDSINMDLSEPTLLGTSEVNTDDLSIISKQTEFDSEEDNLFGIPCASVVIENSVAKRQKLEYSLKLTKITKSQRSFALFHFMESDNTPQFMVQQSTTKQHIVVKCTKVGCPCIVRIIPKQSITKIIKSGKNFRLSINYDSEQSVDIESYTIGQITKTHTCDVDTDESDLTEVKSFIKTFISQQSDLETVTIGVVYERLMSDAVSKFGLDYIIEYWPVPENTKQLIKRLRALSRPPMEDLTIENKNWRGLF